MNASRTPRIALLLAAFCLTLSMLVLRDRLDTPQRVQIEDRPAPVLVIAGT
jgi:hypothetical protein